MKKIRNTIQRDVVLKVVQQLAGQHPNADDIYQKVSETHPHISRGTVYRNLNILCEMGLISKVSLESGADRFDALIAHHAHFQCRICHRIFDVPLKKVIYPESMTDNGFVVEDDAVLFKGLCPECAKNNGGGTQS